jgi:FixJ family two-component response regulator
LLRDIISTAKNIDFLYEITKKRLDEVISQQKNQDALYKEVNEKLNILMEEHAKKDTLNKQIKEELDIKNKTVDELQKKIDEIKVIEKSINNRKNTKEPTT